MSLLSGARISFLGDSFLNKLNNVWAVLLLPLCDQANHGFGSPSEPHQLPDWLCVQLLLQEQLFKHVPFCGQNGTAAAAVLSTEL